MNPKEENVQFPPKIDLADMRKEIDQIEKYLEDNKSPARLTHNDLYVREERNLGKEINSGDEYSTEGRV